MNDRNPCVPLIDGAYLITIYAAETIEPDKHQCKKKGSGIIYKYLRI